MIAEPVTSARHTQTSASWYTPAVFADAAREVFGGTITLDPASCEEANELIGAESFYTEGMNGLILPWRGSVFVNPPGGDDAEGAPLVPQFWRKLHSELFSADALGDAREAIWIGYSIEQLQTLQGLKGTPSPLVLASAICFPRKRIAFVENAAMREQRIAKRIAKEIAKRGATITDVECNAFVRKLGKSSPSHANYVAYIGEHEREFRRVFSQFGECR